MANLFHPDLLPANADPQGSVRYENVDILHITMPCKHIKTISGFTPDKDMFVVCDYTPDCTIWNHRFFKGTIIVEADGSYSWWRSLIDAEN